MALLRKCIVYDCVEGNKKSKDKDFVFKMVATGLGHCLFEQSLVVQCVFYSV